MKPKHPAVSEVPPVFRVGLLADLHTGSRYALVPPAWRPAKAGPASVFMAYMWACWENFCQVCPPLDVLLVNGDSMEGEHPTLRSAPDAIDTNPLHQVDMAVETLSLIRPKARVLWMTRGTGFHEGKWAQAIEDLARELRAESWSARRWSGEVLDGSFAGHTFNVSHAQTFGAIYQGTLLDRTGRFAALADALAKCIPADIIIRSHTHQPGWGNFNDKLVISTRAWKLVNPHAIARMEYFRALASLGLGAQVLTFGNDGIAIKDIAYEPYKAKSPRKLA